MGSVGIEVSWCTGAGFGGVGDRSLDARNAITWPGEQNPGAVTTEQRDRLLGIRREHPTTSAALILRTLELDGRLEKRAASLSTLRRLYLEHGLDRATLRTSDGHVRLRWQADRADALVPNVNYICPFVLPHEEALLSGFMKNRTEQNGRRSNAGRHLSLLSDEPSGGSRATPDLGP